MTTSEEVAKIFADTRRDIDADFEKLHESIGDLQSSLAEARHAAEELHAALLEMIAAYKEEDDL